MDQELNPCQSTHNRDKEDCATTTTARQNLASMTKDADAWLFAKSANQLANEMDCSTRTIHRMRRRARAASDPDLEAEIARQQLRANRQQVIDAVIREEREYIDCSFVVRPALRDKAVIDEAEKAIPGLLKDPDRAADYCERWMMSVVCALHQAQPL